jgi:hypothetical protein
MFKTGNNFADFFCLAIILLPLIPVILISFQRNYGKGLFNFLLVVCLLGFLKGLALITKTFPAGNQSIITNICSLLEMILLIQIFKTSLTGKTKDVLNIIIIAFLSVYITYFSIKGWSITTKEFEVIQSYLILAAIIVSLPPLIRATNLGVFESPLFWITGGTLVYFFLYILLEWVDSSSGPVSRGLQTEKNMFLSIAALIRYSLYILAVLLAGRQDKTEKETTTKN